MAHNRHGLYVDLNGFLDGSRRLRRFEKDQEEDGVCLKLSARSLHSRGRGQTIGGLAMECQLTGSARVASNARWIMLTVVFLSRISAGFQFQSIAAISPALVPDLGLTHAQLGWLIGLFSLPGILVALPGGIAGQRLGDRAASAIGLSLMIIGSIITAHSLGFAQASFGRAISGVGGVVVNIAFSRMVAAWFTGRELATAMGVMLSAWPTGMGLALLILGNVAEISSWRSAIEASALAAGIALILVLVIYKSPAGSSTVPPIPTGSRLGLSAAELKISLAAGFVWAMLNASLFVFVSFAPAYLVSTGFQLHHAGSLVSLALWLTMLSLPLGGLLADRTRRYGVMIVVGAYSAALGMLGFIFLPLPSVWSLSTGMVVGAVFGPVMALLPGAINPERLSAALGVYYSVFYVATALAQPLAGFARDVSGSPLAPLLVALVLMSLTPLAFGIFRRTSPA